VIGLQSYSVMYCFDLLSLLCMAQYKACFWWSPEASNITQRCCNFCLNEEKYEEFEQGSNFFCYRSTCYGRWRTDYRQLA
jgi:hypothetical protein